MESANEFFIIPVVVRFVVEIRGQNHAHGPRGKVIQFAPDHGTDVDSRIGTVQMEAFLLSAVVQNHVETARHRNDQLVQILVRVPAALGPAGNVIKIVNALDLEGDMPAAFDEREIASRFIDFGEINHLAFGQAHEVTSSLCVSQKSVCNSCRLPVHDSRQ